MVHCTDITVYIFINSYVDLIYAHRPDTSTPIEETVRAMNWVIDHGYAFYWGTSEWTAQQITEAWDVAHRLDLIGPAMEQPEYNLLAREKVSSFFQFLSYLAQKNLDVFLDV